MPRVHDLLDRHPRVAVAQAAIGGVQRIANRRDVRGHAGHTGREILRRQHGLQRGQNGHAVGAPSSVSISVSRSSSEIEQPAISIDVA